jgi:hypothetical protein
MKKMITLTALFVLFTVLAANSQIQRGNLLVGADIANFNMGLDKGSNFVINLDPKIAIFLRDNLALGGYLNFGLTTSKGAGESIDYGIGALGRYYFSDTTLNFVRHSRFFIEANVGIEGTNPASGENTNGLGIGIGPGWSYFITSSVGLEALVKYRGIIGFGSRATTSAINLGIGFQIYLPTSRLRARLEGR